MNMISAEMLSDLNSVGVRRRNKVVRRWLAENDEYRLSDVTYAISLIESNAEDDRQIVSNEVAMGAIAAGVYAVLVSIDAPWPLQWFYIGIFVFLVALAVYARHELGGQLRTLDLLYGLRDRAPRRVVRPWRWSRQGQVYLTPER